MERRAQGRRGHRSICDDHRRRADSDIAFMRATSDVNGEAVEIQAEITYQAAADPWESAAELHDLWLEYEPAQKQARF